MLVPVLLAAPLWFGVVEARAADQEEGPAKVVFANGGRILSMNADGTGREVLFGKDRSPQNDGLGAIEPDVSPDGETVVFGLRREVRGTGLVDIWRVGADGSNARRILASTVSHQYGDPAFTEKGLVIYAWFRRAKRVTSAGLSAVDPTGGKTRSLLRKSKRHRPYTAPVSYMEPAVSPDGRRILYLENPGYSNMVFGEGFENRLMVLDTGTGQSRELAESAYSAAWSPDGKKVVFGAQAADDDLEICWWMAGCDFESSLSVVNADGSGRRAVTRSNLDERNPDWSEDGRIIFQSARNLPETGEATEIYSVRPDGRCLTMLTNGSPASLTPVWADEGDSRPRSCGVNPPESGVELRLPPVGRVGAATPWLGDSPGTRLLSNVSVNRRSSMFLYLDCERQRAARCERPVMIWNLDACVYRNQLAGAFRDGSPIRRQRGLPVYRSTRTDMGTFIFAFSGRSVLFKFGGEGRGRNLGKKEFDQLRGFGEEEPTGDLPARVRQNCLS